MFLSPYNCLKNENRKWYKSNFHIHAGTGKNTCGAYEIDDVVSAYKGAGYEVLTISNHDIFSDVSNYQKKYDITLINGFEYSQSSHMLCINSNDVIIAPHQEAINECKNQEGFVILCHPNWQKKEYWSFEDMDRLKGYSGIEIYNGVVFKLKGSGLATDKWDYLLSQGKLVWGFGNDDFHRWHNLDRVWTMVYSPSSSQADIIDSVLHGCFYVSTGLTLNRFDFKDNVITVCAGLKNSYVKTNTYVFIGKEGKVLKQYHGEYASYEIKSDDLYVRVKVISEHGALLWTQPVYNENIFAKP